MPATTPLHHLYRRSPRLLFLFFSHATINRCLCMLGRPPLLISAIFSSPCWQHFEGATTKAQIHHGLSSLDLFPSPKMPLITFPCGFLHLRSFTREVFSDKLSSNNKIWRSTYTNLGVRSLSSKVIGRQKLRYYHQRSIGDNFKRVPASEPNEGSFDIFRTSNVNLVKSNKSLYERGNDVESTKNGPVPQYLRRGMVLLKNFLSHIDQVKIVNKCRDLGIGHGGFYTPGYENGVKLHVQMMCFGKHWDPQSSLYKDSRSIDNAVPPEIPEEFKKLVDDSLHASHKFLRQIAKNVNQIPKMSPDICIVNFYSNSGRLGLHQDRDESECSLKEGLPVVSFSIGDSAKFLYSDMRWEKAEELILRSGDVLIFGGKSRHIFHGVSHIIPNTAPKLLINETNFRPGRLNLTFRKY